MVPLAEGKGPSWVATGRTMRSGASPAVVNQAPSAPKSSLARFSQIRATSR